MFLLLFHACSFIDSSSDSPQIKIPEPPPDIIVDAFQFHLWPPFQIEEIVVDDVCETATENCIQTSCTVRNTYQKPNSKEPTSGKVVLKYSDRKKLFKKTLKVTMPFEDTVHLHSEFTDAPKAKDSLLMGGCSIHYTGTVGSCIVTNSGGKGEVALEFTVVGSDGEVTTATVHSIIEANETKEVIQDFELTSVLAFSCKVL